MIDWLSTFSRGTLAFQQFINVCQGFTTFFANYIRDIVCDNKKDWWDGPHEIDPPMLDPIVEKPNHDLLSDNPKSACDHTTASKALCAPTVVIIGRATSRTDALVRLRLNLFKEYSFGFLSPGL